jgi:hypothetical protein
MSEAELELLRKICGADSDARNNEGDSMDHEFDSLARRVATDMVLAASRRGRDDLAGLACFFCGASGVKLSRCSCSHPESFGCGINGRTVCPDCEQAHKAVAAHLEKLFGAPIVNRVNAKRFKFWHQLSRAVRAIDPDADVTTLPLFCALADCDEFDTDKARFRTDVLRAFREVRFLDFQALAKNIKQEEIDSLLQSVIRAGFAR